MTVRYTDRPSQALPGEIVGAPVRLPHIMLCQAGGPGSRFCGWLRTANTPRQFAEYAAQRRDHERACKGGLIVAGTHG